MRDRIITLIQRFVEVLASDAAAVDETHTPKLYAKFLHGQLKHVVGGQGQQQQAHSQSQQQQAQQQSQQQQVQQQQSQPQQQQPEKKSQYQTSLIPKIEEPEPSPSRTPTILESASTPASHYDTHSLVHTPDTASRDQWTSLTPNPAYYINDSWSSVGSGSQTAGAPNAAGEYGGGADGNGFDSMELCDDELLATMQAVTSDSWANTMLMPGFRWPMSGDDVVMTEQVQTGTGGTVGIGGQEQQGFGVAGAAEGMGMWEFGVTEYVNA